VQRSSALQTRDRREFGVLGGPGSAVHHIAALVVHRIRDKELRGFAMLDVSAIDLHYGAAQALRGISLKAEVGKVTCVLGRNGVGKTSLLRAIVGQRPVSAGSIALDGADITKLPTVARARSGIAFVPQGREIFPLLTVAENLETGFAPLRRDQRTVPDDVFSLFPVLNSMLKRRGGDLSGGQQQQLAIGRALVMRPRLLLLDEPTEGIQPSIIKDIGRAISYLRSLKQMAIVLVEQYLDFAQELGDHLVVMDRGSIVYAADKANLDEGALKRALAI
jgi:urea transport system ATP-binding protein